MFLRGGYRADNRGLGFSWEIVSKVVDFWIAYFFCFFSRLIVVEDGSWGVGGKRV